ncbi:helix-hairpin-helix domain-containing protein [Actinobaculum sp. 313]|uniref:ComEA family DNA-binding protein n=1 Tax=Actinobaculum sp. 313 TaxID=2495645 RepID=UPI00320478D8
MAGGMTQDADQAAINLAAPIRDGDHVHIAAVGETSVPAAGGSGEQIQSGQAGGSGLVNINTATASELQELPGIGPVLADAIVAWREENGGFSAPEELMEVSGIGQATFEKLRDHVVV